MPLQSPLPFLAVAALAGIATLGFSRLSPRAQTDGNPTKMKIKAPELVGGNWLGSSPISLASRRGKVTLVHFWTFASSGSQANLSAYGKIARDLKAQGVAVIGVHTPELAHERDAKDVAHFVAEKGVTFPVLVDEERQNWKNFGVRVWPTVFLIDKRGKIRQRGEGDLEHGDVNGERKIRALIETLLKEKEIMETTPPKNIVPITLSDAQWKDKLSPEAFQVLRKHGTEPAFSGALNRNKEDGTYHCAGCNLPLFSSETKFDSGTGWPSFYQPLAPNVIKETRDNSYGMTRVETSCARCGGHLGHVFEDGPNPTGLRYCMNSVSLEFEEKE